MKLKEFGPPGGRIPRGPPLDPPLKRVTFFILKRCDWRMLVGNEKRLYKSLFRFGFQAGTESNYHFPLTVISPVKDKSRDNWTGVPAVITHKLNYSIFRYKKQGIRGKKHSVSKNLVLFLC